MITTTDNSGRTHLEQRGPEELTSLKLDNITASPRLSLNAVIQYLSPLLGEFTGITFEQCGQSKRSKRLRGGKRYEYDAD